MFQQYSVRQFARLAGVTVRTLHYYDECGLLKPSAYTSGNHRLYEIKDLLRLQQILTLKHMGFSLEEIQALLSSPAYEIRRSMTIQKQAIDAQIQQLQQVSEALGQAIVEMQSIPDAQLDWVNVGTIIRGIVQNDQAHWARQYYNEEAWQHIEHNRANLSGEAIIAGVQAWDELIADFKRLQHKSPEDTAVQALAARMSELIDQFTQGNASIRSGLERMYADFDNIPQEYRKYDRELQQFMNEAFRIYEQRNGEQEE